MLISAMREEPCELLEWDSRHFGLKIGRVRVTGHSVDMEKDVADWRKWHAVDCLYLLAPSDRAEIIRLAEVLGFRLVDIRVTYERRLGPTEEDFPQDGIREFRPDDLASLRNMAGTLHRDSRFFSDTRFPQTKSRGLFETWIEKACEDPAHCVLVAELEGVPVGYVACQRKDDGVGQIQLIGVGPSAQGRGIGRRLVGAIINRLTIEKSRRLVVVTQGKNVAAQQLYQKCGFVTGARELWYHWWSEGGPRAHADGA
jgi:dTDP-4-amino-4,6-dideoxy-D-galactose acyltransferase